MKTAYRTSAGKPEGKRLLDRPSLRCKDNIITDPKDIECENVDWSYLT
jgi:hypothetical protein